MAATFIRIAALLGALSVGLGAFAAHGLRRLLDPALLVTFETGVRYQFYHVFALLAVGILLQRGNLRRKNLVRAGWSFVVGIGLFSCSLYLLALEQYVHLPAAVLGPITPLGGLAFIAGWVFLAFSLRLTKD